MLWVGHDCQVFDLLSAVSNLRFLPKIVYDATGLGPRMKGEGFRLCSTASGERPLVEKELHWALATAADAVVVGSKAEYDDLDSLGVRCHLLQFTRTPDPTPNGFDERDAFLLNAAPSEAGVNDTGAVQYFCQEIWPRLRQATAARLIVIGGDPDMSVEAGQVLGLHEDLVSAYNAARVFVVPNRFGSGTLLQILEIALRGIPMVVSDSARIHTWLGAEKDYLVARSTTEFVEACTNLYRSKAVWEKLRKSAMRSVMSRVNSADCGKMIGELLEAVFLAGVVSRTTITQGGASAR